MKAIKFLLTPAMVIAVAFFSFSCNQAEVDKMKSENEKLQTEINSLKTESSEKDKTISDFFNSFNEIEANLATIKGKEQGLSTQKLSGEVSTATKEQIVNDIKSINSLMEENKSKLSNLQSKLKKANINVKQMEEMMANLQKQIADQEVSINELKTQLANANTALASLNDLYTQSVAEGTAKEDELNKAYYVAGTYTELRDKNVVSKTGGIVGLGSTKQLKSEFNKEVFQMVDIRKTNRISTYAKEAKLLTNHPATSYELVMEAGNQVISIKDAKAFWASSKYLVIEQKKK